ncbi:IS3 family transposase [Candidatus Mycoplasma pogonae]
MKKEFKDIKYLEAAIKKCIKYYNHERISIKLNDPCWIRESFKYAK